jgi:hypothetical protein
MIMTFYVAGKQFVDFDEIQDKEVDDALFATNELYLISPNPPALSLYPHPPPPPPAINLN